MNTIVEYLRFNSCDNGLIESIINYSSYGQYCSRNHDVMRHIPESDYTLLKLIYNYELKRKNLLDNKNEEFTEDVVSMPRLVYIRDPKIHNLSADEGNSEDGDVYSALGDINDAIDKGCDAQIAIYELKDIVTVKNETKILED